MSKQRYVNVLVLLCSVMFLVQLSRPAIAGSGLMSAEYMTAKAQRSGDFCSTNWNSGWLGSKNAVRSYPAFQLSGTDLAMYRSNSEPMMNLIYAYTVEAARSGKIAPLKKLMLNMAMQGHFTKIAAYRPQTWHGQRPAWLASYNTLAEPVYHVALFLVSVSQAFAILEPHLTVQEGAILKKWGSGLASTIRSAQDGSSIYAYDRRAAKAAALVSWGAASGDQSAYRAGVLMFKDVVAHIQKDGRDDYFAVSNHEGRELKYLNMTYGHLSLAAAVMESRGQAAFGYRKRGGSLVDGLNFLISRSLNPATRTKITREQHVLDWTRQPRHVTDASWSFMEFAASSGVVRQSVPDIGRVLGIRGRQGFFGGHHGGYTSCLFGN